MDKKVEVSVLMAVYNTDFLLTKRAIDSVLNQDFQDFELIIIDDGSKNNTHNQLLNYAQKREDKITYLRHANCGQAKSINRGVLNSSGNYITIIDSDDQYKSNHLSACLQQMNQIDLIASTTDTIVDTADDYFVPDQNNPKKLIHIDNCILFATLFGRKEVFNTIKFEKQYAADALFFANAAKAFRVKKVNLRTYIYYRNMPNSICATIKKQNALSFESA